MGIANKKNEKITRQAEYTKRVSRIALRHPFVS